MPMNATRRQNLIKAIRKGMLLSYRQASHVVDVNWMQLATLPSQPLHTAEVVPHQQDANVEDYSGMASVYVGDDYVTWLTIPAGLMQPILTTSIARAYGLPDDLVAVYEQGVEDMLRLPLAA